MLLTSTPRDYYVPLYGENGKSVSGGMPDKLTHAGIYGIDCSIGTLEKIYDIKIDYYVRVNFTSLKKIVDLLGGVEVYSDYDFISDWGPHGAGTHYKFKKGYNKVNGKNYYSSYDKSQIIAFTAPKTPSLKAQAVSGHKVKLTWKPIPAAYQNGKCEYVIYYRNAKDKSYQRLTNLSDTKGSYTTKALKKNNTYYFRMRSSICDENGNHSTTGTYSNTVKVTAK